MAAMTYNCECDDGQACDAHIPPLTSHPPRVPDSNRVGRGVDRDTMTMQPQWSYFSQPMSSTGPT